MSNNEFERELKSSLEKEVQMNLEEEKLENVIKLINEEILKYIDKRKEISEYILDYRKGVLEEYRDDEDKLVEYFDHERYVKEEAFKTIDKRLKELTILSSAPYFGRVDFSEAGEGIENIYVGRFGMTPDGSYEPVVVDWRAPISSLFYTSSLGESSYSSPAGDIDVDILLKRQFIIKKAKLMGLFDSAIDVKDDILQMVLSSNTGEKLRDIIMTIQEEQDDIIRQPREKTVIVNGVAGSGKTTIALHRVAYLLYNYRNILQDKVLILGPNNIFMEYISTVLPSLGEVGVKQTTFTNFALDVLNIGDIMSFRDYMERVLAGDEDFINSILHKTSQQFIEQLDSFVEKLDKEYFKTQEIKFLDRVVLTTEEIDKMFYDYYKDMPLLRRSKKIKRIIFSKLKDFRDEEVRAIQKEYKEEISKLTKGQLEYEETNLNLIRKIKIREVIKEVIRAKSELTWLHNPDSLELYNQINDNKELTTDDLAPIIYLKIKLEGLKINEEIKHIVIDEAQDYSPIQFAAIRELTRCSSMTIVGDSNQRLLPLSGEIPMLNLGKFVRDLNIEYYSLNKSYRSTREIMEYANKYLEDERIVPLVRSGKEVKEESFKNTKELLDSIENTLAELQNKGYENIAVLCRDLKQTETIGNGLKNSSYVKVFDREDIIYNGGTVVIPSYFAKGLEFDAVILVEDKKSKDEKKLSYVMSTRALHELYAYKI